MEKEEKNFVHGCRVSRLLVLCVLTIEYSVFFLEFSGLEQSVLLLFVYASMSALITCNSHGKNVLLCYEQELSLLMKCLVTDFIMGIILQGNDCDNDSIIWNAELWDTLLLLLVIQMASIVILCVIGKQIAKGKTYGKLLYIYENRKPFLIDGVESFSDNDNMEFLSVNTDFELLRNRIRESEAIYLYDVSAVRRNDLLKCCFELEKPVYFSAKLSDVELRTSQLAQDGDSPIFFCKQYGISKSAEALKRFFDFIGSVIFLIIFSPLFAIIAICIKLEDGQSVFYRQIRCTKDMKQFEIIKFRSMVSGAEDQVGVRLAAKKDQRLTKVGYVLRKLKLDELPQLVNIFKGDMSFVGPRPERLELMEQIMIRVPEFRYRTTVKAGLTGYAQVHGDYHTDFLDKLKWDLMYIENYSLLLDLKIILMTVPAVLHGSDDV